MGSQVILEQMEVGVLTLVGEPTGINAVSVKPDTATITATTRLWGRINDVNYSVPMSKVKQILIIGSPADTVFIDSRVTLKSCRLTHDEWFARHSLFPGYEIDTVISGVPTKMRLRVDRIGYLHDVQFQPPGSATKVTGTGINIINAGTFNTAKPRTTVLAELEAMGWGNLPYTGTDGEVP